MKTIFLFLAVLVASTIVAQPTISVTVNDSDVTHNSIIVKDQITSSTAGYSRIEFGSASNNLTEKTQLDDRSGTSTSEIMLVNLTGTRVFYRVKFFYGNDSVITPINEVQLKTSTVLYLKVENLEPKNIVVGEYAISGTLRALLKCNASTDVYFEYGASTLPSTTGFITKGAGIDTVEINFTGLAKTSVIYFRANALSGTTILSAPTISTYATGASAISELWREEFKIFPNPVNDQAVISGNGDFILYDITGKKITQAKVAGQTEIFRNNLPTGVYAYEYLTNEGKVT